MVLDSVVYLLCFFCGVGLSVCFVVGDWFYVLLWLLLDVLLVLFDFGE